MQNAFYTPAAPSEIASVLTSPDTVDMTPQLLSYQRGPIGGKREEEQPLADIGGTNTKKIRRIGRFVTSKTFTEAANFGMSN